MDIADVSSTSIGTSVPSSGVRTEIATAHSCASVVGGALHPHPSPHKKRKREKTGNRKKKKAKDKHKNTARINDRLCGLVVRVSGYRYRGPGFDPRRYQIF